MHPIRKVRPRPLAASVVCLLLLLAAQAKANIGERWHGTYGSEPWGGIKNVVITREELDIDLRPLVDGQPAVVQATYHLRNNGPGKRLELLFVAGGTEINDFEVRLDGRLLPSKALPEDELTRRWEEIPKSWKVPIYDLPGIDTQGTHLTPIHAPWGIRLIAFSVVLPEARSTLRARYRARVPGTDEGGPTTTWQMPYVLAPARDWGGFGRLDVRAYLPAGWQHVSRPALQRDGDLLHGSFEGVPDDLLVVDTRAPLAAQYRRAFWVAVGVYIVALLAGGFLCHRAGWWFVRGMARWWRSDHRPVLRHACVGLGTTVLAVLWPGLLAGALALAVAIIHGVLGLQEAPYVWEGLYMAGLGTACLMLITLPLGIVLAVSGVRSGLARARGYEVRKERPVS
jgi:hypothetical protein